MSSDAELHLSHKLAEAPIQDYPYPHVYIREAFPPDFYERMQAMLPDPAAMKPLPDVRKMMNDAYRERFVIDFEPESLALLPEDKRLFWSELHGWMVNSRFRRFVLEKFDSYLSKRFHGHRIRFYDEALLVQDTTHYALGPHSDAPRKVITMLFYLPRDESQRHLGTSIYVPTDRKFRCPGGPHYSRENFERIATMPFLPNSLFAFVKNNASFHGVEPVTDPDTRRWLLLYDIYHSIEDP